MQVEMEAQQQEEEVLHHHCVSVRLWNHLVLLDAPVDEKTKTADAFVSLCAHTHTRRGEREGVKRRLNLYCSRPACALP